MRILLVEDERMTRTALTGTLRKQGHEVIPCPDGDVAVSALDDGPYDLVLTDLNLPGPDGLTILDRVNAETPETKVMIMTAYASAETAVEALRRGAHDYLIKPFQTDELLARIQRIGQLHAVVEENRELRRLIDSTRQRRIVGDSAGMKRVIKTIDAIAPGESSVLIQGPSGTGKELVARATSSLPVPLGPWISTLDSPGAMASMVLITLFMPAESPTMRRWRVLSMSRRSSLFSSTTAWSWPMRWMRASSSSVWKGLMR